MEMMNNLANLIVVMFCVWAVLEKRCKTYFMGTFTLSIVALSLITFVPPESPGIIESCFDVILDMAAAMCVSGYWLQWQKIHGAFAQGTQPCN